MRSSRFFVPLAAFGMTAVPQAHAAPAPSELRVRICGGGEVSIKLPAKHDREAPDPAGAACHATMPCALDRKLRNTAATPAG